MLDIKDLMKMLQSNDPDKRYDACNRMKLLPSLPFEALEALRTASKDEDPAVAEKAQETIKFHANLIQQKEKQEKKILEEEKAKILADEKEKSPRILHMIISIIYMGIIVLNCPLILLSLAGGVEILYELAFPVIWVTGSIFISRILINRKNIRIAFIVLFSAPVIAWLFLVRDTMFA